MMLFASENLGMTVTGISGMCVVLICSSWYHLPSEKVLNMFLNFVCYLMHINLLRKNTYTLDFLLENNQNLVTEILFMRAV